MSTKRFGNLANSQAHKRTFPDRSRGLRLGRSGCTRPERIQRHLNRLKHVMGVMTRREALFAAVICTMAFSSAQVGTSQMQVLLHLTWLCPRIIRCLPCPWSVTLLSRHFLSATRLLHHSLLPAYLLHWRRKG